jgi:hypothetical protein
MQISFTLFYREYLYLGRNILGKPAWLNIYHIEVLRLSIPELEDVSNSPTNP